ncbi:MAG: hypothetical protein AAF936_14260 [Pseudomonadota bacterium]
MTIEDQHRYQDIAIFHLEKGDAGDGKSRNRNPYLVALIIVLATALLIAIGYIICLKTGILAPPNDPCCFGIVELDFDFGG